MAVKDIGRPKPLKEKAYYMRLSLRRSGGRARERDGEMYSWDGTVGKVGGGEDQIKRNDRSDMIKNRYCNQVGDEGYIQYANDRTLALTVYSTRYF